MNLGIQGLRGLAITAVFIFHFGSSSAKELGVGSHYIIEFASFGKYGVQLFFMISGYIIFHNISKTPTQIGFVVRRINRIYPAVVVLVPLMWLFNSLILNLVTHEKPEMSFSSLAFSVLLLNPAAINSVFGTDFVWVTGVLWTLPVELVFYGLVAALMRLSIQKVLYSLFWLLVIGSAVHLSMQNFVEAAPAMAFKIEQVTWQYFIFYLPWFLIGATIWLLSNSTLRGHAVKLNVVVLTFSFLFIQYFALQDAEKSSSVILRVITPLIPIFLVVLFTLGARKKTLPTTPLHSALMTNLGSISFEFYLIHEFLGNAIIGLLTRALGENEVSGMFWIFSIACIWFLTIGASRFIKTRVSDKFRA
jgi:peptidoglycan/LPS O-acetylase OafA/YrhL